jgi:hypothetical protein
MKGAVAARSRHEREQGQGGNRSAALARSIQDRIGSRLRAMYDGLKTEPVPDRILDLLKRMEKSIERQSP